MDIDLTDRLVETATKVVVQVNEYGDRVYGSTSQSACLYRDISDLKLTGRIEVVGLYDGILWFGADESVEKGDIYYHPSEGYLRIEKITKAKTLLSDDTVQFIKCKVTRQRQIS